MKTHYKDIFTKQSECGEKGKLVIDASKVDCFDCLELNRIEWERQVKHFKHQPLINAKEGLKIVMTRMKELGYVNEQQSEGDKKDE